MQIVVPRMEHWLAYEAQAKAEGRREPYSLDRILREEIPEGKTICNKEETSWHRHVELNGPGPEAYAVYNIVMCEFEERKCSR